jgi:hypothetical protein
MSEETFSIGASELAQMEAPRKRRRSRVESAILDEMDHPTTSSDELPVITGNDGMTAEERRLAKEGEKVQNILSANKNTGAKVMVSRKNRQTGRFGVLATIPIDEYDEDQLQVEYGGGQYLSRVRLPNGRLGESWTWDVDPSVRPYTDGIQQPASTAIDAIPRIIDAVRDRNSGGENIREVIETITDRNAQTFQMMMKQMQDSNAQMLTLITTMNRQQPAQDTMMSSMMNTMLSAIMTQKTQSVDQLVDAFVKLKDLSGEGGGAGKNDVMDTIIGMMAPLAGQLMGKLAPQLPVAPVPQPLPETAQQNPNIAQPKSNVPNQLKAIADMILRLAQKDTDPVSAVNVISDLIDEKLEDKMREFLANDNWWTNMMMFEDRVIPYKSWFEKVREEFLDIYDDSEEGEQEESAT